MTEPPDPSRRDPAPTRRDDSPAPTRRDEPPDAPADHPAPLLRLPEALARRYRPVRQLPTRGAEADLLLIEPTTGGTPVVCKLYRPGLRPNTEVLSRISASHPQTVVRILEHGVTGGISYEIMEWAEHGSLRVLLDQGMFSPTRAGQLLTELHAALGELHAQHILHRDLKPENLLVRGIDPLRIALTDFGIASVSETTLHFTSVHRTVRYAAPEAAAGVVSPASDYWSVGMILAEALTGRHPFAGLSERVVALRLSTHPVPLEDLDEPWLTLCRGLLVRDPAQRWGKDEIDRWLAQDRTLTVPVETDAPRAAGALRAGRPYRMTGKECWTGTELAAQLAQHWTDGVKGLQRNLIAPWLRDELHDQDSVLLVMDLLEDQSMTPDQRLLHLILHLAPEQSPVWKGMSLAVSDLTALARRALQGEAECRDALAEIWDLGVLPTLARAGHAALGELHNRWSGTVTGYRQGWEKAIAGGAPATEAPDLCTALPVLLLTVSDDDFVQALRNQAERERTADAMACSWYPALAILDPEVPAEALILSYLLPRATEAGSKERLRAEDESELEAAQQARLQAEEQQRTLTQRRKYIIRRNVSLALLLAVVSGVASYLIVSKAGHARILQEQAQQMVFVRGGTYTMGSPPVEAGRGSDERQHSVTVEDFYMGKYEVTQREWKEIMGDTFSQEDYRCLDDRCPIRQVRWSRVQEYIKKLNLRTGMKYRLPTEAEWEYACRSGGKPELYCGGDNLARLGWYEDNRGQRFSYPVGQKEPNGLGLYDMSGNVDEWTCSAYREKYDGAETQCATDGTEGTEKRERYLKDGHWAGSGGLAARGGSALSNSAATRSASRDGFGKHGDYSSPGFRLAHD